jgi:hypothetical protein
MSTHNFFFFHIRNFANKIFFFSIQSATLGQQRLVECFILVEHSDAAKSATRSRECLFPLFV